MIDIYYVEDDENIARIVKEYLEQRSCRVSVFHTIAAAQKGFRRPCACRRACRLEYAGRTG